METPLPSLQSLRVLDAAARLRSYARAAEELGLTHGAVSHQIKSLEAWVNAPLFERIGREMAPTERALGLLARTRTAIGILGEAFGHPVVRPKSDGLILSTTPGIARLWLLPRMTRLPKRLLSSIRTHSSFEPAIEEPADVHLRYGPGGWPNLQSVLLSSELISPVGHPNFLAEVTDDATRLLDLPLLVSPFQTWLAWFQAAGVCLPNGPAPSLELSDMSLVVDAAVHGIGVALAPQRLVEGQLRRRELVRLSNVTAPDVYGYYLAWPPTTKKGSAIADLRDWLVREFS